MSARLIHKYHLAEGLGFNMGTLPMLPEPFVFHFKIEMFNTLSSVKVIYQYYCPSEDIAFQRVIWLQLTIFYIKFCMLLV